MTLAAYLRSRRTCPEAINWVAERPASDALWRACEDVSWMLWLAGQLAVRHELLVLCASGCARSVLHLVPVGEYRPARAVAAAEMWAYGRGTVEQAYDAAHDAVCASVYATVHTAAFAADAAADAAYAVAFAADAATYAVDAAVRAAHAAAEAVTYAVDADVCSRALTRYARGVRQVIPWWHVADCLRRAGVEVEP